MRNEEAVRLDRKSESSVKFLHSYRLSSSGSTRLRIDRGIAYYREAGAASHPLRKGKREKDHVRKEEGAAGPPKRINEYDPHSSLTQPYL